MLTSIALIILLGLFIGSIFTKLKLPSLVGMILIGIILGPHMLNLLDSSIIGISYELRQIALVIILTRAGLALDIKDLKKVGIPAILMCFIPATLEILGFIILGPKLLNLPILDSAILGTVIAAVSPAVIVPRMLKLMEEGYGTNKSIPQLILAGASVDDIFVIVLFTSFTSIATTGSNFSISSIIKIPISIIIGIILGILTGIVLVYLFKKIHIRDSIKILIILSVSFLFITVEDLLKGFIPISGLLAVMSLGATILKIYSKLARRISNKYSKLWVGAEVFLFVLVGASVDIKYVMNSGIITIILILGALVFRIFGVLLSLIKTEMNFKERLFSAIGYMPKATVQAAIGALPLSMGLASGEIILTVAVLSIIITAPLGATLIDNTYKKLLSISKNK
ncbi:cation:proton antiporter [Clostridium tertium]|uniref:cation:proton antiporter domain-containing protein n=2 Tax=Clostridium tertium TaxID=1559 RepID=UPI00232B6F6F|nr:cation:proton antiporter [Clostridium tertium]MDB1954869.1 cation:proton antiporter [Clostridium tertium]MDB1959986.1 cation:proton antiporter [Clostridium tertium]MDB1963794.1 cation:proton antiporter [Clostridium tertium]MDB1967588.1 cation:proton antiporter [Clostridium tertium]